MTTAAGLLCLAVLLGWSGATGRPQASANAVQQMASAQSFFDSTIVLARVSQPRGVRGDELAIALGYVERLRIGVGSPFRLVDDALADPRLGATMSPRVAWGLLARLRRGDAFIVDSAALEGAGPWGRDGHGATGRAHIALIERAIASASDPRAGELAVRMAYMIEGAKGTLAATTPSIATQVAALVRDRALAQHDLDSLLSDAAATRTPTFTLLQARRVSHAFAVEQPSLAPLPQALQVEAMNAVPALVRALDTLDRVDPASTEIVPRSTTPVIGPLFAARLAVLGAARPPIPEIYVTLKSRARPAFRASNEETLVASYDVVASWKKTDAVTRESALAMLESAVADRTRSQDEPWFPGDGGPDASNLTTEFGLAGVTFESGVPAAWRPYYLRELQLGLRDMATVFPAVSFNGAHFRFLSSSLRDSALALHDPRDRTIELPIATAGGTLAHELSHDLDWQTSRRLYAQGSGYSTDRAMRDRRGVLATSLRVMADARAQRPFAGTPSHDRPAELFARGADWFVASVLAQDGRTNGFLTAIEDGMLPGYAAGSPAGLGAAGNASLVSAIEAMTYLPDSIRLGFESQWSDPDAIDPTLLVRRVIESPLSWRTGSMWSTGHDVVGAPPASVCTNGGSPADRARETLLNLAIDARAHGLASRRARYRPSSMRPGLAASVLGAPAVDPDAGEQYVRGLRAALVADLGSALADQGVLPVAPAIFRSNTASCSSIVR